MQTERHIPLPMGRVLILTTDTTGAMRTLAMRRERLRRLTPLLRRILTVMRQDFQQQFLEGGNPAWKPLAASTIAKKAAAGLPARTAKGRIPTRLVQNGQFGPGNILIETGRLRDAWSRRDSKDHLESVDSANGSVRIGPRPEFDLARWHQRGTPPRTITARRKNALAFITQKGMIVRRSVNHPGLPARPVRVTERAQDLIKVTARSYFGGDDGERNGSSDSG